MAVNFLLGVNSRNMNLKKRKNHSDKATPNAATIIPFLQNGDYFYQKGISAYQKHDFKKAIKYMEKAIQIDENEPVFHCQLAAIYAELGEYERSNEILHFVLEQIDDSMDECYFFMANNYAHIGLIDKAEAAAKQYMEKRPTGEFYTDSSDLLELLDFERGDEDFEEEDAIIIEHEHAIRLLASEEYERAILQLTQIIEQFPTYWAAYNHLANAYFKIGKQDEAIALCYQVLEEDEGNIVALCHLALFYFKQGKEVESQSISAMLEMIHPLDLDIRFKLASTFCAIGKYGAAYQTLIQLQKKYYHQSVDFFRCLAVAAFHHGKTERAQEYWKRASEMGDHRATNILKKVANGLKAEEVIYD